MDLGFQFLRVGKPVKFPKGRKPTVSVCIMLALVMVLVFHSAAENPNPMVLFILFYYSFFFLGGGLVWAGDSSEMRILAGFPTLGKHIPIRR